MNIKEGDNVKFKLSYGWGGSNPDFYGKVVKHGSKLYIEGDDYEDSLELNSKYVSKLTKVKD